MVDMTSLSGLLQDLPRDAFEPVPFAEGTQARTLAPSSSQDVPLDSITALNQALETINNLDSNAETLRTSETLKVTKPSDDLLPDGLQPVTDHPSAVVLDPIPIREGGAKAKPSIGSLEAISPLLATPDGPKPKRRRISSNHKEPNFRPYQEELWAEQFHQLVKFKEQHGHCLVPSTSSLLSRWVKRQRYQYKLKMNGKLSTMTDCRIQKLNGIGFVWHRHSSVWCKRLKELKEYREKHGNCNVPYNYPENQNLATWVKCQRRQYGLFWSNTKQSSMTLERINALDELGFRWNRSEDGY